MTTVRKSPADGGTPVGHGNEDDVDGDGASGRVDPAPADAYAAMTISSTARASSPVTSGSLSCCTQSTKCAISCGKP